MATLAELRKIARDGGSVRVHAGRFHPTRLVWLARDVRKGGGTLTLVNAGVLRQHERGWIEREAPRQVIFEFE